MNPRTGFRNGTQEQDNRYWRRRANRRVRKARITRNFARWSVILVLHLTFGSLVLFTGHRLWRQVSSSQEFALKRIELVGVTRTKSEAIRRALDHYLGGAVLDLNLAEIAETVQRDPWVLSASVRRVLPDALRIEVEERTPSAIAIIGGLAHVVDSRGFVIGPTGLQHTDDLPVLTGLPPVPKGVPAARLASAGVVNEGGIGAERLAAELLRGVQMIERLRRTSPVFVDEISELDLSRRDRVTLRTVMAGPLLLLDPEHVERNVLRFLALRPAVQARVGSAEVVDLRWEDRVSVMPIPQLPESEG